MQVAYLINQYPKVSHSFIRREIRALERKGLGVTRIALRGWADSFEDPADEQERSITKYVLRNGPIGLLVALARVFLINPIGLLQTIKLAFQLSRRAERPLLVHLIYLAEACQTLLWLREAKAQHLHAHFGTNSAEISMMVRTLGGPSWSFTAHGPEEFDKADLLHLTEKLQNCSFAVAICSYGRAQLYRHIDLKFWDKVHIVHCGLEEKFFSSPVKPVSSKTRLVCVGRLCEQKGQILLVEAARKLWGEGLDFELVLAGDGDLRADIETLLSRYNLEKYVRITGWINESQVIDEISSSRALILPSFAEGLPVVIMEAMALRRPIISTYVAGIPELVKNGEHGWLVPAGDVEALVQAIKDCFNTPDTLLASMGEAAHQKSFSQHFIDDQADLLIKLFASYANDNLSS